jgi:hypothetical protein
VHQRASDSVRRSRAARCGESGIVTFSSSGAVSCVAGLNWSTIVDSGGHPSVRSVAARSNSLRVASTILAGCDVIGKVQREHVVALRSQRANSSSATQ